MYWGLWNFTNFPSMMRTLGFYDFFTLLCTGDFVFYNLYHVIGVGVFKFYKFCVDTLRCYDVPMYWLRPLFFYEFLRFSSCIGDFEFLQISIYTENLEFLRNSACIGTLSFYDFLMYWGLGALDASKLVKIFFEKNRKNDEFFSLFLFVLCSPDLV